MRCDSWDMFADLFSPILLQHPILIMPVPLAFNENVGETIPADTPHVNNHRLPDAFIFG
jgi:hypothetical protein